jgi:energy-coupling factor transporter ATP-binding protein EcfA2
MNNMFTLNKPFNAGDNDIVRMALAEPVLRKLRKKNYPFFATFNRIVAADFDANIVRGQLQAHGEVVTLDGNWNIVIGSDFFATLTVDSMGDARHLSKVTVEIYSSNINALNRRVAALQAILANIAGGVVCEVLWYYGSDSYDYDNIYEMLGDTILNEAYPFIPDLPEIAREYAESRESVLVLIGEPGTGKSRLIRYLIRAMAEQSGTNHAKVFYTSQQNVLDGDGMFTQFRTSDAMALILEDADYHLGKRSDGNDVMTRLLAASDSFIADGRKKIILSTNLATLHHIDAALIRPGRCYGIIETRKMTRGEAQLFLKAVAPDRHITLDSELYTLAELYRLLNPGNETVRQLSDTLRFNPAEKRAFGFAAG